MSEAFFQGHERKGTPQRGVRTLPSSVRWAALLHAAQAWKIRFRRIKRGIWLPYRCPHLPGGARARAHAPLRALPWRCWRSSRRLPPRPRSGEPTGAGCNHVKLASKIRAPRVAGRLVRSRASVTEPFRKAFRAPQPAQKQDRTRAAGGHPCQPRPCQIQRVL